MSDRPRSVALSTIGPKPDIAIYYDNIIIEGKIIHRPMRMSPKQWLDFWENVNRMEHDE